MDYVLLIVIAASLGAGAAGGLISAWNCHRRVLVLEESFKLVVTSLEDRITQLSRIATRQDKTEAAKVRWTKKEMQDQALAQALTKNADEAPYPAAWDRATWGS